MASEKSTLDILARRDPITEAEWEEMIAARVRFILPFMRSLSVGTISDVRCVRVYTGRLRGDDYDGPDRSFADDAVELVAEAGLNKSTRGIFWSHPVDHPAESNNPCTDARLYHSALGREPRGRSVRIWGLTRNGEWIIARLESVSNAESSDEEGYVQTPTRLIIQRCTPRYLVEAKCATFFDIWNYLRLWLMDCVHKRREVLVDLDRKIALLNTEFELAYSLEKK